MESQKTTETDDDYLDDDFNFNDIRVNFYGQRLFFIRYLKLSNSSNKKGMLDQTVMRTKPNKTFAMIKNEMEEKAKKKSKIQSQVYIYQTCIVTNDKNLCFSLKRLNISTNTGILPSALVKKMSNPI